MNPVALLHPVLLNLRQDHSLCRDVPGLVRLPRIMNGTKTMRSKQLARKCMFHTNSRPKGKQNIDYSISLGAIYYFHSTVKTYFQRNMWKGIYTKEYINFHSFLKHSNTHSLFTGARCRLSESRLRDRPLPPARLTTRSIEPQGWEGGSKNFPLLLKHVHGRHKRTHPLKQEKFS